MFALCILWAHKLQKDTASVLGSLAWCIPGLGSPEAWRQPRGSEGVEAPVREQYHLTR